MSKMENIDVKDRLNLITKAVVSQAQDEGIWFDAQYITEQYLQESIRDLHSVIENGDIEAFNRIKDRLNLWENEK